MRGIYKALLPLVFYGIMMFIPHAFFIYPLFITSLFFLSQTTMCLTFLTLILWSGVAASLLLAPCYGVLFSFKQMAGSIGALFLFVYSTLVITFIAYLFFLIKKIIRSHPLFLVLSQSALLVWWWVFNDQHLFSLFGAACGYMVANPFFSLAAYPLLLAPIQIFGVYWYQFLFICMIGAGVYARLYASRACLLLSSSLLIGLIIILFIEPSYDHPVEQSTIGVLRAVDSSNVLEQYAAIKEQIDWWAERQSLPELLVGSETVLSCPLNNESALCENLQAVGLSTMPLLLLGAQRAQGRELFNALYCLDRGRIIYCYDKQFPLPFLETTSSECDWFPFLKGLFFSRGRMPYSPGGQSGLLPLSLGGNNHRAYCRLCSDFFCMSCNPPALATMLLVLVHDTWSWSCVATHMLHYAQVQAIRLQFPILYVGSQYACWIDSTGRVWQLESLQR